jgi:hypothetical protein
MTRHLEMRLVRPALASGMLLTTSRPVGIDHSSLTRSRSNLNHDLPRCSGFHGGKRFVNLRSGKVPLVE